MVAGLAGFGESTQSGPAPRSSANVAVQIAQIHAKYLSRLEDMFYKSLYEERLKAAARAQQNDMNSGNNQSQSQQQVLPPNAQQQQMGQQHPQISTQFLEAVARGSNSMNMLNDQQRRALEGRKPTGQTPTNSNQNQTPNQIPDEIRQPQSDIGVLQAMRQNPKMAAYWVKSRENHSRLKSRKSQV